MTILVVAAHPDDEVLGCGGTAAAAARRGEDVHLAIFGEGITSRYAERESADASLITSLHGHSDAAAKALGASGLTMYGLPDNRFDTVAMLDVIKLVEELIDKVNPEVVYTHHAGDLNVDHVVLNRAVLTATRPMEGIGVREVLTFEIASSSEWAFNTIGPAFHPNVFVDITDTLETKIEAMEMYASEARPYPHPRSPDALRAIARRWGSAAGMRAAEAFQLVRSLR